MQELQVFGHKRDFVFLFYFLFLLRLHWQNQKQERVMKLQG